MNKQILYSAVDTYGKDAQTKMAIEEMSELMKELCKNYRGKQNINEIAEEIADVEIMLEQLKIIFECSLDVIRWKEQKMQRLEERLVYEHAKETRDPE